MNRLRACYCPWMPTGSKKLRRLDGPIERAMARSLAAEQAKRLAAMQAAENNVLERIDSLNARYRRQRQASITAELLEVTAGFMVLEREAGREEEG